MATSQGSNASSFTDSNRHSMTRLRVNSTSVSALYSASIRLQSPSSYFVLSITHALCSAQPQPQPHHQADTRPYFTLPPVVGYYSLSSALPDTSLLVVCWELKLLFLARHLALCFAYFNESRQHVQAICKVTQASKVRLCLADASEGL